MVIGNIYYSVRARMCLTVIEVMYDDDIPGSKPSAIILRLDDGKIHKTTYEAMKSGVTEKKLLPRGQSQNKTAITISSKGTIITLLDE